MSAFALITAGRFFKPLGGPAVNFCFRHSYFSALARIDSIDRGWLNQRLGHSRATNSAF